MIRTKFNITSHAVFIPFSSIAGNFFTRFLFYLFIDPGVIVTNQLAAAFKNKDGGVVDYSLINNKVWIWRQAHFALFTLPSVLSDPVECLYSKLILLYKSAFVFSIVSVLSSIALHIATTSAVVLYIMAGNLMFSEIFHSPNAPLDLQNPVYAVCSV